MSDQVEALNAAPGNIAVDLIAGGAGGILQIVVGMPLDCLKTRAQTAPKGQFNGTMDILRQTVRKEGVLALYKGMLTPLVLIGLTNSLLFTAYGACKRIVSPFPELSIPQTALAGAGAGAINAVLASPSELFKIKMQGQYGGAEDKKLAAVVREQYSRYGFRHGIMRGYWVTVAREIPAYAAFYAAYEYSKRNLTKRFPNASNSEQMGIYMSSGATGGIAYWLACYPLDVVKSKVQLQGAPPTGGLGYIGREMAAIVKEGGISALFRGISPSLIRSVPAAASTFLAFEVTKSFIEEHKLL